MRWFKWLKKKEETWVPPFVLHTTMLTLEGKRERQLLVGDILLLTYIYRGFDQTKHSTILCLEIMAEDRIVLSMQSLELLLPFFKEGQDFVSYDTILTYRKFIEENPDVV